MNHTVKFLLNIIESVIPSSIAVGVFLSNAEAVVKIGVGLITIGYIGRQWYYFEKEKRALKQPEK